MALTDNILAYWKFDESSGNAADSVGTSTGVNTDVTYAAGKINNGSVYNGTSAILTITDNAEVKPSGDFTISFWLYKETLNGAGKNCLVFQSFSQNTNIAGFRVNTESSDGGHNNEVKFLVGANTGTTDNTDFWEVYSGVAVTADVWQHWVCVHEDGVELRMYLNGSLIADEAYTAGVGYAATNYVRFGVRTNAGSNDGNTWLGLGDMVDECGLWDRVLSPSEITELYNGGSGFQYPFVATNVKTINGLAQANVKTVNGLAIASVKSWNGLE